MKMTLPKQTKNQGSVLMIGLCIATIVGIVLGSFLYLIRAQHVSVVRGQNWNAAMAMAEAGVEEALAHLNLGPLINIDKTAHGWTLSGGNYSMPNPPRRLTNGCYIVSFNDAEPPLITSTGYLTNPITGDAVSRIVQVQTALSSLFAAGIVAKTNITLNGKILVNSFDSADPNYSGPNGSYDPTKTKCNGDIASRYGIIGVGNATICGTLHMGPDGTYSTGPIAQISGGAINDMNKEIPDVPPPFTDAMSPTSKMINDTNYDYVMGDGNYKLSSLGSKPKPATVYVYAGKTATLYVSGYANVSAVYLQPGAVLKIYVGGPDAEIANVNSDGNPYSFQLWGLSTLTSLTLSGNQTFVGVIYAPGADMTLNGSGDPKTPLDVVGAMVVKSLTGNGHFNVHYDENLARAMPASGYVATNWKEL